MANDSNTLSINVVPEFDYKPFERQFRAFRKRMDGLFHTKTPRPGIMESLFFPKGKSAKNSVQKNIQKNMQAVSGQFSKELKSMGTDSGIKRGFSAVEGGFDRITKAAIAATSAVQDLNKLLSATGGGGGRGGGDGRGGGGGKASWWDRMKGKWYTRAAAFGGGAITRGLWQFATEAYGEGIRSYEARETARLRYAPFMMGLNRSRRGKYTSGTYMGFDPAEAAVIQSTGAQEGLGRGRAGGRAAFELTRALGETGIGIGGGIMRRGGLTGSTGTAQMMKTLSKAFTVAVKTGLDEARVPEFLGAANRYAEEQLAITPDKRDFTSFTKELARVQLGGGPGMAGRYGAAALSRVDKAMKGATGVQQAFLMRAYGFGKGADFMDVLRRQERGIAGAGPGGKSNVMAVMEQLRREYGAGQYGGLSQQALLAFKGMGFGSTYMGQKFGEIYLQQKSGKISPEEAQKKVREIMDKKAEKDMPSIQKRAYKAMANFGRVAGTLAERFSKMANLGEGWFEVKKNINKIQISLAKMVDPLIKGFGKGLKSLVPIVQKWAPKIGEYLQWFVNTIPVLIKSIKNATRAIQRLISTLPFSSAGRTEEEAKRVSSKIKQGVASSREAFHSKYRELAQTAAGRQKLWQLGRKGYFGTSSLRRLMGESQGVAESRITSTDLARRLFGPAAKGLSEKNASQAMVEWTKMMKAMMWAGRGREDQRSQNLDRIVNALHRLRELGVRLELVPSPSSMVRKGSVKAATQKR